MSFSPVKFWLGLLLAAVGVYGLYSGWKIYGRLSEANAAPRGVAVESPHPAIDQEIGHFQLTERSGQTFDSDELRGQVWVASFFFADCPGACLKMNNSIAELQTELADQPVRFVSITVDPAKDTPERLREYAQHYQADASRWVFLTGEMDAIRGHTLRSADDRRPPGTRAGNLPRHRSDADHAAQAQAGRGAR
jgi:cytochrome oxidase Cu insertion factor (SCO1/SenC/PrrC family)